MNSVIIKNNDGHGVSYFVDGVECDEIGGMKSKKSGSSFLISHRNYRICMLEKNESFSTFLNLKEKQNECR